MFPTIPAETFYTDIERDVIENEPPGMFPEDQNSYWGQMRKLFSDYMQANAVDLFTAWYNNLDPRNVDANDINEWEARVGVPGNRSALALTARRTFVQNRLVVGAFGRPLINAIIENFITATFGASTSFGTGGITLDSGGVSLLSGLGGDPKTMYRVYFDYMNHAYYVRVLNTVGVDLGGLTRELQRITPAGWALNISQVANVLDYTRMVINCAPLMYYHVGANANDSSGYTAFPGTVNGTVTFGQTSLVNTAVITDSAALFNGTTGYVSAPDGASSWPFAAMSGTKISVEAWMKPAALPSAGNYMMAWSKGTASVGIDSTGKVVFAATIAGTPRSIISVTAFVVNATHHIVATYDGKVMRLYVDGGLEASATWPGGFSLATATNIGRNIAGTNGYLNGTLDEVAVYDRVLSDTEVLAHFRTGTNVA